MPLWLIIGIGSFIGGILRYWISGWVQSGALTFPLAGNACCELYRQLGFEPDNVPF